MHFDGKRCNSFLVEGMCLIFWLMVSAGAGAMAFKCRALEALPESGSHRDVPGFAGHKQGLTVLVGCVTGK